MKSRRRGGSEGRKRKKEKKEKKKKRGAGVILHSSGVCLAKSGSARAEDYGIMASAVGHVSWRGRH